MTTLGAGTMIPAWLAVALAAPTMLVIAWHILSVQQSSMDVVRRRVRIINGLLMMFVSALLAFALGMMESPDRPRTEPHAAKIFVLVWTAIVGLLCVIVALAVVDAAITTRSGLRAHRDLQRRMNEHERGGARRG